MAVPFSREPVFRSWARGTTSCKAFSDWWKASVFNRPVGFRLFFWPKAAAAFLPPFRLFATFCFWFDGIGECLLLFWCWSLFGFFWLALLFVFTEVLWFMLAAPGFDFDFFFFHSFPYTPGGLGSIGWPGCRWQLSHPSFSHLGWPWTALPPEVLAALWRSMLTTWRRTSPSPHMEDRKPQHVVFWSFLAVSCFLMRHGVLRHDFKWVACLKPKKNTAGTRFWRYRKHDGNSHGACKKAPDASFKWFKSQDQI